MSDDFEDFYNKKNVYNLVSGGKKDEPEDEDERVPASDALRQFADMLEQFELEGLYVEVAGVAMVPDIGVALCGNSETGRDGMNTMLDLGKTAIVMEYLNAGEDYDDDEPTIQ
jgi:hypothetical protein